jgi:tripartite-type tricarboxylate transporter receptor subunit TctC
MVRLVVPFSAGSMTDLLARVVADKLSERWKQQVIVENRPGLAGTSSVAKAAADGYTLMLTSNGHTVIGSLNKNLSFDPIKDFVGVSQVASTPLILVAPPESATNSVKDLIEAAKAKPGALNYGSAGVASLAHLATALFASMAGVSMTHVPYKSSAQSVTDMITGRLDMQFATIAPSLANIRAGQLRALVTSGSKRVAALPEVPTVAESGIAGYEAALWVSLVAPSATPPAILARLNREVNEILESAEGNEAMIAQGMAPEPGRPDAVTARIRADIEKWRAVVTKAGIRPD